MRAVARTILPKKVKEIVEQIIKEEGIKEEKIKAGFMMGGYFRAGRCFCAKCCSKCQPVFFVRPPGLIDLDKNKLIPKYKLNLNK